MRDPLPYEKFDNDEAFGNKNVTGNMPNMGKTVAGDTWLKLTRSKTLSSLRNC